MKEKAIETLVFIEDKKGKLIDVGEIMQKEVKKKRK